MTGMRAMLATLVLAFLTPIPSTGAGAAPSGRARTLAALAMPGDLDSSFGTAGKTTTDFGGDAEARAVALQADGRIVTAGFAPVGPNVDFALARYNHNGSLDTTFGNGGRVAADLAGADDEASALA